MKNIKVEEYCEIWCAVKGREYQISGFRGSKNKTYILHRQDGFYRMPDWMKPIKYYAIKKLALNKEISVITYDRGIGKRLDEDAIN